MIGVVLAGGASARFNGQPKGLLNIAGRPMALHVADILSAVCDRVAIEAQPDAGYEALSLPLIHALPEHAAKGPLAALAAGLGSARQGELVAFAPCDMPLLTSDIYRTLMKLSGGGAYVRTSTGVEPLVAVLNPSIAATLLSALKQEALPRTHAVLDAAGARAVDFASTGQFANVNTPDDLARVEQDLRR